MSNLLYRAVALPDTAVEGRRVFGLAAPFNQRTTITEHGRTFDEVIERGAFARTIAERGHKVKILNQHEARRPIGKATVLEERADGLYIEATISDTRDGNDALQLVRDGVLDSFSIGFRPIAHRNDDGVKVLTEIALHEVSIVTFPAYPGAVIGGVRAWTPPAPPPDISAADALDRLAAIERKNFT